MNPLERKPMKRTRVPEDWADARAKIEAEGGFCRVCGANQGIEGAHSIGKEWQDRTRWGARGGKFKYVPPDAIIPLCGPATTSSTCHGKLHAHRLNLLPYMNYDEQANAVAAVGMESAYRKLTHDPEGAWLY